MYKRVHNYITLSHSNGLLVTKAEIHNRATRHSNINLMCPRYKRKIEGGRTFTIRELKQITTAGATTAALTEKVWGEYVSVVCQILAKRNTKMSET